MERRRNIFKTLDSLDSSEDLDPSLEEWLDLNSISNHHLIRNPNLILESPSPNLYSTAFLPSFFWVISLHTLSFFNRIPFIQISLIMSSTSHHPDDGTSIVTRRGSQTSLPPPKPTPVDLGSEIKSTDDSEKTLDRESGEPELVDVARAEAEFARLKRQLTEV